jgi:hypothetical protein
LASPSDGYVDVIEITEHTCVADGPVNDTVADW